MSLTVHRAGSRARTEQPGITSWHSFSSGAHYDPDNLSFGPIIACDEHRVAPGAGFAAHRHARVELVSWVLAGTLAHDDGVRARSVPAGELQYQRAGTGIAHTERNASATEPLRFVQLWLSSAADRPRYASGPAPLPLDGGAGLVLTGPGEIAAAGFVHLFVGDGRFTAAGHPLAPGDTLRATNQVVSVTGAGRLLVISVEV